MLIYTSHSPQRSSRKFKARLDMSQMQHDEVLNQSRGAGRGAGMESKVRMGRRIKKGQSWGDGIGIRAWSLLAGGALNWKP